MNRAIEIGDGTIADLEALEFLERTSFGSAAWSRAGIAAAVGSTLGLTQVARLTDVAELAGAALWQVVADEAELLRIAVAPALRGMGIGARLLERSRLLLTNRGVLTVHLEVRVDNTAAIALYRADGWRDVGLREGYYGDDTDALLMGRALARD